MTKKKSLLTRFLIWRLKHIKERQFILILSMLIGITVGLAAVVIKNSVHFISHLVHLTAGAEMYNYLYFIYPIFGIMLAVLFIKYVIKRPVRHGIPSVLYSISKNNGVINRHNMFSSIVTSAFTVGFGGSVGLEGPTVATGAAWGANIGRLFHLNYKQITLLLACACTGAMAAIFKAPIAAIVFALEVIMIDLTMWSLLPILISSLSAVLTSYFFLGQDVLYPFEVTSKFELAQFPYYIGLGILCGLVSAYFTKTYMKIERFFSSIKSIYKKLIIGGLSLGIIIFFFPSLYGEGYESINMCLEGNYNYLFDGTFFEVFKDNFIVLLIILLIIILFKVIAASITFGSGGVGGIFAPTLFMGVNTGVLYAMVLNKIGFNVITNNFGLIGMAGLIAGVLHAPLTAIFLIADISGGYQLFVPIMITATIAYATVKAFESNSVYTIQLARRKELLTHDKDKNVLSMLKVTNLVESDFKTINEHNTLGDLCDIITQSKRNIYPVIDEKRNFKGIVHLDDVRNIMFKPELYDCTYVRDLLRVPQYTISYDDEMEKVAHIFQSNKLYNIAVLNNGKYLGFVSRAKLFSNYRRMLKHFSND